MPNPKLGCCSVFLLLFIGFIAFIAISQQEASKIERQREVDKELPFPDTDIKGIPGLTKEKLLNQSPFKLRDIKVKRQNSITWQCDFSQGDSEFTIEASGPTVEKVRLIGANIRHKSGGDPTDDAKPVLLTFVGIQFDGADPEKAKRWLANNMHHDDSEITIGGVHFWLVKTKSAYNLTIDPAPTK